MQFREPKFRVLTPETTKTLTEPYVFYGIEPQTYERLAEDLADMLRWSQEMTFQLDYYRKRLTDGTE